MFFIKRDRNKNVISWEGQIHSPQKYQLCLAKISSAEGSHAWMKTLQPLLIENARLL